MTAVAAPPREQRMPRLPRPGPQVGIDRLAGLVSQLEADRPAGLPLAHRGAVERVAVGGDVLDPQGDDITPAQLAVQGDIGQGQVPLLPSQLQVGPDGPDVLRLERRFRASRRSVSLCSRASSAQQTTAQSRRLAWLSSSAGKRGVCAVLTVSDPSAVGRMADEMESVSLTRSSQVDP